MIGLVGYSDAFVVDGLSARTSNDREMSGAGEIPGIWKRWMQRATTRETVAVYSEYESDKDGLYTFTLGTRVMGDEVVLAGLARVVVPGGDYACFSAEGKLANDTVVGLWKQVWLLEDSGEIRRAYKSDYEIHRFNADGACYVALYIGVKN